MYFYIPDRTKGRKHRHSSKKYRHKTKSERTRIESLIAVILITHSSRRKTLCCNNNFNLLNADLVKNLIRNHFTFYKKPLISSFIIRSSTFRYALQMFGNKDWSKSLNVLLLWTNGISKRTETSVSASIWAFPKQNRDCLIIITCCCRSTGCGA